MRKSGVGLEPTGAQVRLPDDLFYVYEGLGAAGMILIVWTMVMISHHAFLTSGTSESWWLMQARRVSLSLVGVAIAMEMSWHMEHGRATWLPEYMLIGGMDLYLATAIYSSYQRLNRLGLSI